MLRTCGANRSAAPGGRHAPRHERGRNASQRGDAARLDLPEQCRFNFPHLCRSKIPQAGEFGDQPAA